MCGWVGGWGGGAGFRRQSAALLHQLGVMELIAQSVSDYIDIVGRLLSPSGELLDVYVNALLLHSTH